MDELTMLAAPTIVGCTMSNHLPVLDTSMPYGWIGGPSARQIHIALHDVKPVVWRRIVIPSDASLRQASRSFVAAMGWQGYHLHAFKAGHLRFGPPDEDFESTIDEAAVTVAQLWPRIGDAVTLSYDFGDGWEHTLVLESIVDLTKETADPSCLDGAQACPPEDCGGPWGYGRLLEALADPADEEHEQLKEWAPAGFDPAYFDPGEASAAMRRLS